MRRDVQEIFRNTPHEKQVMMFSATLSKEIRPVCKKFMQDVGLLINITGLLKISSHEDVTLNSRDISKVDGRNVVATQLGGLQERSWRRKVEDEERSNWVSGLGVR